MSYNFEALSVLLVDGNVHMHQVVRSILQAMRITRVRACSDMTDAFRELAISQPDVIITDLILGEDDGLEFIRTVRLGGNGLYPYVPILLLTGHTEIYRIQEARDAGVTEVLAKPVSIEALYKRLVTVVTKPRPYVKTRSFLGPDRRRQDKPFAGADKRVNDKSGTKAA